MINKGTGDDCLGTDGHGFEKGTAGLRDGNGLICLKAILKYRHGWAAHRADRKAN